MPPEVGLPSRHRVPGLPERVTVYEVGARDGLQAEAVPVPTAAKVRMIRELLAAGLPMVEATSFVSPRWIPQLADAPEVVAGLAEAGLDLARHPVLVPNDRGLDRALEAGAGALAVFVSATETFARRNLNMERWEAVEAAQKVTERGALEGRPVRGYVSMVFGDPWEGPVAPGQVAEVARALLDAGCYEVSLGDTIGVGTPGHVGAVVDAVVAAGVPRERLALHLHDTYGQALANVYAGLLAGVETFDASVGGIGGCPYAGSATGNLATEDLLWMLTGLGVETGVDLDAAMRAGLAVTTLLGRPSPSRVVQALRPN
ncbi:hydroxymethylglutaryl-CoA lyase [Phycicoccus endophyticus]|uniref:Hydroxymethylglutaryl-CoA lyase n=1 Tax=Phycicoccus endophyticus TaxID=1690220 RepID=A0A7G9R612_9MICO|nr:hydroxymethylglutaryl-CoA lyase [Phycicoccus endophyticus]QNN51037.1 hydroxymethylglutaryl-CoA lyase [Phycicoccus endophyticus]